MAREDETDLVCSFSELLRIFLCGASSGDSQCLDRTLRGRNGETLLRAVAQRAASLLGSKGEPTFDAGSWKLYSFRRIFPIWLDYAFITGARTFGAMDLIDRLIASDTVEERVLALHKEKQAIAEDVLEGTASTSLTPAQLLALFR